MKRGQKKPSFKAFGNFFALHMMKRLVSKKSKVSNTAEHDGLDESSNKDAIEAGFTADSVSNPGSSAGRIADHLQANNSSSKYLPPLTSSNGAGVDLGSVQTVPGVFGLTNHGNTCFVNSILQCLSNTDVLAEFFVMGQYKHDLKNCRKERSKKYGTRGEVTEALASVVRSLWTGTYTPDLTKQFKNLIAKYASQYKGNAQHDSQEFLLWLFDKMHEDLNLIPTKKFSFSRRPSMRRSSSQKNVERKNSSVKTVTSPDGKSPTDSSPSSFIQKTFQGQYRSSLICPNCKKKSNTTDPFLCISLPIKQRTMRPAFVNVTYLPHKRRSGINAKNTGKTVKIGVSVHVDGKVIDLRQAVSSECGIHSRLLAFVEVHHDGFHSSYGDDCPLTDIPDLSNPTSSSPLCAFEMPPVTKLTAGTLPRNFASKYNKRGASRRGKDKTATNADLAGMDSIVVLLLNKHGVKDQGKRFGLPLVFRASRDILQTELQMMVLNYMGDYLKHGVKHEKLGSLFRLQVLDGLPNKTYLSPQAQQPLRLPTVEKALDNCPAGGPLHIKLMAEWDNDTKAGMFEKIPEEKVEVQESVRLQRVLQQQPVSCSLEECFDLYTQAEELDAEDAWLCPHCHKQQHGTMKKLSLYSLPDILILHLKRFRVAQGRRTKLCTRVDFPVTGLNISKHIYSDKAVHSYQKQNGSDVPGWDIGSLANREDCLYDLYAICNHYGSLNSGHYTASCCNPLNGKWYQYDDNRAEVVKEADLSPQSAYILFYQRRSAVPAMSCGGVSNNSIMSDHWSYHLPQFKQKVQFNSQSHLNQYSVSAGASYQNNGKILQRSLQNGKILSRENASFDPVNRNCNKIDAALSGKPIKEEKKRKDDNDDSDEGGFNSPSRPYVRGLRRQGSAVVGKQASQRTNHEELRGRQYRSYRNRRRTAPQTSPV